VLFRGNTKAKSPKTRQKSTFCRVCQHFAVSLSCNDNATPAAPLLPTAAKLKRQQLFIIIVKLITGTMHSIDTDVLIAFLLYYTIFDAVVAAVRIRKQNITRDREAALARLNAYADNEFKRRFRMHRYQFDMLVSHLRTELEPQTAWAKQCAINSSGSWVKAELKIAATLRVLAGGSYLDASDLFAVSATSFHRNTFWPVIIAVCNCTEEFLDNVHFPFDDEEELHKHERTFTRFQKHFEGTAAAGDGCAFRIKRPSARQVADDVQSAFTRKYSWAYGFILFCDGNLNIMSVEATHVASTNDAGMYEALFIISNISNILQS
jgi:hypothetical protein